MTAAVSPAVFRAGWDAALAGRDIATNPHPFGSPEWVAWREGFSDGELERWKDIDARWQALRP